MSMQGHWWQESMQAAQGTTWKFTHPGQDTLLSQGYSHPHALTLRLGQNRHAYWPHVHIFGMWKETKVTRENPIQTVAQLGICFSPSSFSPSDTILSEDLP